MLKRSPIVSKIKIKTCKVCSNKFQQKTSFITWCSPDCGYKLAIKKKEEKEEKDWQKRKKEGKEKLKTLGEYEIDAKRVFQKWVRMRDVIDTCISCGNDSDTWDGGHFFKSELYSGLIFNEDNCHKQCVYCNKYLHGNEANYRIGLVKKIGEERVKWLEENKDRLRTYSYSKQELIDIKNKYKAKIKEL